MMKIMIRIQEWLSPDLLRIPTEKTAIQHGEGHRSTQCRPILMLLNHWAIGFRTNNCVLLSRLFIPGLDVKNQVCLKTESAVFSHKHMLRHTVLQYRKKLHHT